MKIAGRRIPNKTSPETKRVQTRSQAKKHGFAKADNVPKNLQTYYNKNQQNTSTSSISSPNSSITAERERRNAVNQEKNRRLREELAQKRELIRRLKSNK